MQQLRDALADNRWTLDKDALFYLYRRRNDDLRKPTVVIRKGTIVNVEKVYRRGRAALLKYTDRTGKVWWAWTHASLPFEPVRKYRQP